MGRRKKAEKSEAQKLADAYWSCFTTPAGAIVLEDLKARCGQDRTIVPLHDPARDIPVNALLVNEGARRVYLYMISMMEEAQKDYATGGTTAAANGTTVITDESESDSAD